MTYHPREVSVTRTAPQVFTLTVGDTVMELDPLEAWELAHEAAGAIDQPSQVERLKKALAEALGELHDLLTNDPVAVRAYDLTAEDEQRLAWLSIRVASPWK